MLAYVCRNEAGRWAVSSEKQATMPPWVQLDGPYHWEEALRIRDERNEHRDRRLGRETFRHDNVMP